MLATFLIPLIHIYFICFIHDVESNPISHTSIHHIKWLLNDVLSALSFAFEVQQDIIQLINLSHLSGHRMELRHLRYFICIAEELNFTRASEKLFIAQPSLSQQIKDLENELGCLLFSRKKWISIAKISR